jgi:hypothetical protein
MDKKIDIFYKSYSKDFWLLHFSLASLTKNVTGYNDIVLLIPEKEKHLFDTRVLPERTIIYYVDEYGNGNLYQQWCKLNAHRYCFADYILYADSDCIWDHPIDLQEFVKDDKPEILYTDYMQLPDAIIWKEPTEKFIKEPVQYEFMRRNCMVYHRSTLVAIEQYEPHLESIVMSSGRFSEFNCMGAYAYKYEREKYNFVNTDDWKYVPPKATQTWSHASKADGISETHLREYIRLLETLLRSVGIDIS